MFATPLDEDTGTTPRFALRQSDGIALEEPAPAFAAIVTNASSVTAKVQFWMAPLATPPTRSGARSNAQKLMLTNTVAAATTPPSARITDDDRSSSPPVASLWRLLRPRTQCPRS